jgi:hypothetical protein
MPSSYSYTGSGGSKLGFCVSFWKINNYPHKWKIGDILFVVPSANIGVLEKVCVKQVKVISKHQTNGSFYFLYIDTTNAIYNENELTTEYDALILAKLYFEKQLAFTVQAATICPN